MTEVKAPSIEALIQSWKRKDTLKLKKRDEGTDIDVAYAKLRVALEAALPEGILSVKTPLDLGTITGDLAKRIGALLSRTKAVFELKKEYEKGGETQKKVLEELVLKNEGIVMRWALSFLNKNPHLRLEDLVQEGRIGLMIAFKKFDPQRGLQFVTYASYWIRASIQDYVFGQKQDVHDKTPRRTRNDQEILRKKGVLPTQVVSLQAPLKGEDGPKVRTLETKFSASTPPDLVTQLAGRELLRLGASVLSEREKRFLGLFYGIPEWGGVLDPSDPEQDDDGHLVPRVIGERENPPISPQRVKAILEAAREKLRVQCGIGEAPERPNSGKPSDPEDAEVPA